MSFNMSLWRVSGESLTTIEKSRLDNEDRLETWLTKDSSILGMNILVIGRQVITEFGGRIDLLGLDAEANTVILELKRHRTPREIVAQILDYASWVKDLGYDELDTICQKHHSQELSTVFTNRFGSDIPENINSRHRMVIVASELDDSSERIVRYLSEEHYVDINVIFFNFFHADQIQLLGRAWLMDPAVIQEKAGAKHVPWPGYWFFNVGEGPHRNWDDNRKYGYLSAGMGRVYSDPLKRLQKGDKVFAYMKGLGYVGFGEVTREAVMLKDFIVETEGKSLSELPLIPPQVKDHIDDPELSEWVVGIEWGKTYTREKAKTFKGAFANQNIVCKLRDTNTISFLKKEFDLEE